jgi:Flp pilus assembly pilin Flp
MLKKLWHDEAGAIVSAELVLIATILVIAMVTGLSSLRDAVVTELADVGAAIASQDQSYTVGGITAHSAAVAASIFLDDADFCDDGTATTATRCMTINGGSTTATATGADGG